MDAYQKFRNEITDILNDIDTFMWAIDSRSPPIRHSNQR
nr:MAG TPA: WD-repeat region [Caudoviricetes sp.]